MVNDVGVMEVLDKEVVRVWDANFLSGKLMNTQYDDKYQYRGAAAGDPIFIEQPARFVAISGATMVVQDDIKRKIALTRSFQEHVALQFSSKEITQDLADDKKMAMFSRKNLKGSIQTLCAKVDSMVFGIVMPQIYNTIGTPGTNPATYASITAAKTMLNNYNTPRDDRHFIVTNASMGSLNAGTQNLFNPTEEKADDYRTGKMKKVNQFQFWETDFLPRHTNGTGVDGAITVNVPIEGAATIEVDGVGAAATITEGTTFTIANIFRRNLITKEAKADLQTFTVTADAVADGGGVIALLIAPALEADATKAYGNVSALPIENAVVNFEGVASTSYDQNLFFTKDALVFATCDLEEIDCQVEENFRDEELGIVLKYTSQGNVSTFKKASRLDVLFGAAVPAPWWCGRQWAA